MTYILLIKAGLWIGLSVYGYVLDARNIKLYNNPNETKVIPNLDN